MAASNNYKFNGFVIDKHASLRTGSFGTVYRAVDEKTQEVVAAEEIKLSEKQDHYLNLGEEALEILSALDSPYLVNIIGQEKEADILWVFMEFCENDLELHFIKHSPSNRESVSFMRDMAAGLKYLHREKVVHRDIQPSNILISVGFDHPAAKIMGSPYLKEAKNINPAEGTPDTKTAYMAPELYCAGCTGGPPVDIFALGLIFFAMTCFETGQKVMAPSESEIGYEMNQCHIFGNDEEAKAKNREVVKIQDDFPKWKKQVHEIIRRMTEFDPNKRFIAEEVKAKINTIPTELC